MKYLSGDRIEELVGNQSMASTLHQKVKYLSGDRIEELVGNQSMARQCLVSAILHQPVAESSASIKEGL